MFGLVYVSEINKIPLLNNIIAGSTADFSEDIEGEVKKKMKKESYE